MTYREALEILLVDVQVKSIIYADASLEASERTCMIWEVAEQNYRRMISQMREAHAHPDDVIVTSLR